jgi:peptidoglycan/xylan/chitin deacetylase (PgdA/CDA1 family)
MNKIIKHRTLKFFFISLLLLCHSGRIYAGDSDVNSLLHEAIIKKDFALVKKIVNDGADLNLSNDLGITPVMLAASLNEKEIVCFLIENGVNVNYNSKDIRSINSSLMGNNILKYPEKKNNFFLTFDAGADDTNLDYILSVLKKYHITATFFNTGAFMIKYPDDVKRIVEEGHVVGNHTFSHSFYYKNESQLNDELLKTEKIFKRITGEKLTKIWRTPYLNHIGKPWMLKSARKIGYRHIDVSFYSMDWVNEHDKLYLNNKKFLNLFKNMIDFENISRIAADGSNYPKFKKADTNYNGVIMLMHTGKYRKSGNDFVYTLEEVILHLISRGYYFDNCRKFENCP